MADKAHDCASTAAGMKACVWVTGDGMRCLPVIKDGLTTTTSETPVLSACAPATTVGTPARYKTDKMCADGSITELPDCNGSKYAEAKPAGSPFTSPIAGGMCLCGDSVLVNVADTCYTNPKGDSYQV